MMAIKLYQHELKQGFSGLAAHQNHLGSSGNTEAWAGSTHRDSGLIGLQRNLGLGVLQTLQVILPWFSRLQSMLQDHLEGVL